jgi:hypothetical protein
MAKKIEALIKCRKDLRDQDHKLVTGALRGIIKRATKLVARLEESKAEAQTAHSISELLDEPCEDCTTPEEMWQRSLSNFAANAATMRAYWKHQFGPEWEKFEVTSEMVTLARQAAEEWSRLASVLDKRARGRDTQPRQIEANDFIRELLDFTLDYTERVKQWKKEHDLEEDARIAFENAVHQCAEEVLRLANAVDGADRLEPTSPKTASNVVKLARK